MSEWTEEEEKEEGEGEIISADPPFLRVQCDAPKPNAARPGRGIKGPMMKEYV